MTDIRNSKLLGPIALFFITTLVAMALNYVVGANLPVTAKDVDAQPALWVLGVGFLAFFIVYLGWMFALAWWTRKAQVDRPYRMNVAVWVGIAAGIGAVAIAAGVDLLASHLPGWFGTTQGQYTLVGFWEEFSKLIIPVALIGTYVFRHTLTGFWAVFVASATFGFLEGAGKTLTGLMGPNPPTQGMSDGWVQAINTLALGTETMHILYTAPAAALIWYAATKGTRGHAWLVGIAAWIVAGVLHGFNDAVIGYVFLGSVKAIWLDMAFLLVVLLVWYVPTVRRLRPPAITTNSMVGEGLNS